MPNKLKSQNILKNIEEFNKKNFKKDSLINKKCSNYILSDSRKSKKFSYLEMQINHEIIFKLN